MIAKRKTNPQTAQEKGGERQLESRQEAVILSVDEPEGMRYSRKESPRSRGSYFEALVASGLDFEEVGYVPPD